MDVTGGASLTYWEGGGDARGDLAKRLKDNKTFSKRTREWNVCLPVLQNCLVLS